MISSAAEDREEEDGLEVMSIQDSDSIRSAHTQETFECLTMFGAYNRGLNRWYRCYRVHDIPSE